MKKPRISYLVSRISTQKGFTIVELLVVIAIIALLNGILLNNFGSSKAKSRDAKRISDIGQLQLALTLYYDRCKQYPARPLATGESNGCPVDTTTGQPVVTLGTYISQLPKDPSTGLDYDYYTDTGSPQDFILHTTLEYPNVAQNDSIQVSSLPAWAGPSGLNLPCFVQGATANRNYCVGSK
jgi:prepilin-type N-terminal cleavage/methylation domain-containing protein